MIFKSILFGFVLSVIITILISVSTISIKGRNVLTGESETLKGLKAVIYKIGQSGFILYFQSMLPILVISFIVVSFGIFFWLKSNA